MVFVATMAGRWADWVPGILPFEDRLGRILREGDFMDV
jgi:hypothetical protein